MSYDKLSNHIEYKLYVSIKLDGPTITVNMVHAGDKLDLFDFGKDLETEDDKLFMKKLIGSLSLLGLALEASKIEETKIKTTAKKMMGKIRPKEKS